jgi:phosphoribosylanthranilate isomerase
MRWLTQDHRGVRIKICGVQHTADIDAAIAAGADAVGLVLYPKSPRAIDLATAKELAEHCGDAIVPITLLVNPTQIELADIPTRWVQLHGEEDASVIALAATMYSVLKAVPARQISEVTALDKHPGVSRLLLDAPRGGSGETFDYDALSEVRDTLQSPLIVAGGLDASNIADAIATLRPWGVDVSSGVERTRGVKDPALIDAFCQAVRDCSPA